MGEDPNEAAERIQRKAQRILWASGLLFLLWQFAWFAFYAAQPQDSLRNVDKVRGLGFVAWSAALLFMLASGGGALAGRRVREILDDELAQARRATAYRFGFWAMILVAFAGYALAHLTDVPALLLAHLVLSAGVLAAVLTVAALGRR